MSTRRRATSPLAVLTSPAAVAVLAAFLGACHALPENGPQEAGAPYPRSDRIAGISWDLAGFETTRRAHGSDLWPCAWAMDDSLYCAWGDGGGFDGDSDTVGRVSLGFARISGQPSRPEPWRELRAENVWGAPPFAAAAADFGGKVGSLVQVDRTLFATGRFWTPEDTPDAMHKSGAGPRGGIAYSTDHAQHWTLEPWSVQEDVGGFLDRGRPAKTRDTYVYLYFFRGTEDRHLYLKRVRASALQSSRHPPDFEYYAGPFVLQRYPRWSKQASQAAAIFADANHVEGPSVVYVEALGRYLLTAGHYPGEDDDASSAGRWGMFEARYAWGPWRTVAYYDDWAGLDSVTRGDYLGFHVPSRWISQDGRELWGVFSGLHEFDSFNLVRGRLDVRHQN